jgi:hypothetical protein
LFKFEDAVVNVVAIVHRDVAIHRLRTPNLGWNVDDKGPGSRLERRDK